MGIPSPKRRQILDFITQFIEERDYSPSVREVAEGCGISSSSVAQYHLNILKREGYIHRDPEVSRSIGLPKKRVSFTTVPLLGVIAALWAFVTGGDWLINRGIIHLKAAKEAWRGPDLTMASLIVSMDRDQLRLFERMGPFESIGYLGNTGMRWTLYTPMVNLPYTWIADYLERCEKSYPAFIPQHGMPDSLQRDYVQAFTGQMINNGLAEKPIGSRPAKWILPLDQVYEKLGLSEEA